MNQKLNTMTVGELAEKARISLPMAEWWFDELGGKMRTNQTMTLGEFITSRCDDCHEVIKVYDSADFRMKVHPIRCHACAQKLQDEYGESYYDSYYVC